MRAWSVRLILAAAVLSGLDVAVQLAGPLLPIPPVLLAALAAVCGAAALGARLLVQRGMPAC